MNNLKLSPANKARIKKQWSAIKMQTDMHRKVLEADSVVSHLFRDLGFTGTMGEQLKKASKYVPDLDAVWRAHKLRNTIAHEPGVTISAYDAEKALAAFEKVLTKYCGTL